MAQTSRRQRHYQIVNILRRQDVHSQTVLRDMLAKQGTDVSQATLSRDLFQLQVMRTVDADGALTYRVPEQTATNPGPHDPFNGAPGTLDRVCRSFLLQVTRPSWQVLLKCTAGAGNLVGSALDSMDIPGVVGCVSGNDTVVVYCDDEMAAQNVEQWFTSLMTSTGEQL